VSKWPCCDDPFIDGDVLLRSSLSLQHSLFATVNFTATSIPVSPLTNPQSGPSRLPSPGLVHLTPPSVFYCFSDFDQRQTFALIQIIPPSPTDGVEKEQIQEQ